MLLTISKCTKSGPRVWGSAMWRRTADPGAQLSGEPAHGWVLSRIGTRTGQVCCPAGWEIGGAFKSWTFYYKHARLRLSERWELSGVNNRWQYLFWWLPIIKELILHFKKKQSVQSFLSHCRIWNYKHLS